MNTEIDYSGISFIDEYDVQKVIVQCLTAKMNVILTGPPGVGKTTLAACLAGGERNLVTVTGAGLTQRDLLGRYVFQDGESVWKPGFLVRAMAEGLWLFLDEIDKLGPDACTLLMPLLDGRRKVIATDICEEIHARPSFRVIGAYNPTDNGFDCMPRAFRDRWVYIEVPKLSPATEAKLLLDRYAISKRQSEYLCKFAAITRSIAGDQNGATTRQLESAAMATSLGVSISMAARIAMLYPITASNPTLRTAIEQAILADGLEFVEDIKNLKPSKRQKLV